jgi:uncharacterized zinc-type alcohol dehydrogenase-like protein
MEKFHGITSQLTLKRKGKNMTKILGFAAHGPKQKLEPFTYDAGPLAPEDV